MKKLQTEVSWELADIRDPMIFSLVFYEHPWLLGELMKVFFPQAGIGRIRKMKMCLADILHGSRTDPSFRAKAETEDGEVMLWLDYIHELKEEKTEGYPGWQKASDRKKDGRTLNLTICRSDPFHCEQPVMRLILKGEDLCPDDDEHWVIEGVLVSLHEESEADDPEIRKIIRYFRDGQGAGGLCDKFEKAVQEVKENEEWRLLYLEEKAYRSYLAEE